MKVFNSETTKSKIFQSGKVRASFNGTPGILLSATVTITRQLSAIATLTDGIVWSASPVSGTIEAGSILTNKEGQSLLTTTTMNGCSPIACSLEFNGACDAGDLVINIQDAYFQTVTFTAQGGQGYVGFNLSGNFTTCEIM